MVKHRDLNLLLILEVLRLIVKFHIFDEVKMSLLNDYFIYKSVKLMFHKKCLHAVKYFYLTQICTPL